MNERAPLPEVLERPPRGRVLLLAPHPDDDVIGAGGTLALHREQGDPVHVLIVFDGVAGDAARRFDPREYRARRHSEARAGGVHLGLSDYEFWDYPEGHEPSAPELEAAARRLAERVRALAPDLVYAPWIGEHHVDHHMLARAARTALGLAGFRGEAWGYEVWTPLVPARIVDVTPTFEKKRAALCEHKSQLEEIPGMLHKALALGAQRAMYLSDTALYGEAFVPLSPRGETRVPPMG